MGSRVRREGECVRRSEKEEEGYCMHSPAMALVLFWGMVR